MNKTELLQVRDALSINRVMAKDSDGDYTREVTPKLITAALALIDADLARVVENVAAQFQSRDGNWSNFINDKHIADTIADGTWPIRYLYATPQDAEAKAVQL